MLLLDPFLRCADCYGSVYLTRDYTAERRSQLVHRRSFVGCGQSVGGVLKRQPAALTLSINGLPLASLIMRKDEQACSRLLSDAVA